MQQLMHADEPRCGDKSCELRETCLRYLARNDDVASLTAKSLKRWQVLNGSCRWYIEVPTEPLPLEVQTISQLPVIARRFCDTGVMSRCEWERNNT